MYSIEELEETFRLHHEKALEEHNKSIKKFQENFPDEPLPKHFEDEFSLPLALAAICVAIRDLRNVLPKR